MNQITSQSVRAKMKLPPAMVGPYQRVVMAGQKIMYSPQMLPQIQALLKGPGEIGQKMGQGAIALMGMLIDQSHHTLPPQLIVPAGIELITDFADLLTKAGQKVNDHDIALGMETYVGDVMQKLNITPEKLQQSMGGGAQAAPQAPTAPPATPAAPGA